MTSADIVLPVPESPAKSPGDAATTPAAGAHPPLVEHPVAVPGPGGELAQGAQRRLWGGSGSGWGLRSTGLGDVGMVGAGRSCGSGSASGGTGATSAAAARCSDARCSDADCSDSATAGFADAGSSFSPVHSR